MQAAYLVLLIRPGTFHNGQKDTNSLAVNNVMLLLKWKANLALHGRLLKMNFHTACRSWHQSKKCKTVNWSFNYSLQLPCRDWGWHDGSHNNGPGFWRSWKTNPKTFTALWGLWESRDAPPQSDGIFGTPTASGERPRPTGEDDQPTSVPTESPAQVSVEAPLCLAFPWTGRRDQTQPTCECVTKLDITRISP